MNETMTKSQHIVAIYWHVNFYVMPHRAPFPLRIYIQHICQHAHITYVTLMFACAYEF